MKLLIDSNVVLDYLGANEGFSNEAGQIFELAISRKAIELVSASSVTDLKQSDALTVAGRLATIRLTS